MQFSLGTSSASKSSIKKRSECTSVVCTGLMKGSARCFDTQDFCKYSGTRSPANITYGAKNSFSSLRFFLSSGLDTFLCAIGPKDSSGRNLPCALNTCRALKQRLSASIIAALPMNRYTLRPSAVSVLVLAFTLNTLSKKSTVDWLG